MRAREFLVDNVSTGSDSIAVVNHPLGSLHRRVPLDSFSDKYHTKQKKVKHARRRFKNSISN